MNKLKKIHPNMEQFLSENIYGMNKIKELANKAGEMYNSIINEIDIGKPGAMDRLQESEFKEYLSPKVIDLLQSTDVKYLSSISYCSECGDYVKVGLFGFLKLGERAVGELPLDIKNHYRHDERMGSDYFDLDSCLNIGLKIKPLDDGAISVYDTDKPMLDVSTILVRALNTGNVLGNQEEVDKAILTVIISKLFILFLSRNELRCIIDNCMRLKHDFALDEERSRRYDFRTILLALFAYKIWYNSINDINPSEVHESVSNVLDLVKLASQSFNATQAVTDVYNTIHSKIMSKAMDVPRYPDHVIQKALHFYRLAMNYYGFRDENGRRHHANLVRHKRVIGVESVVIESFLGSMGVAPGFRDKKRASLTMLGFENMQTTTREFDEFKKKSRGQILAKLSNDERGIYIRYESDIMKFRAEAIGCNTTFSQGTILKKGETLAKLINMELSKEHSDDFVTMMGMLDTERLAVQTELANRDFYRERNTRLNGNFGSLKDEWTY